MQKTSLFNSTALVENQAGGMYYKNTDEDHFVKVAVSSFIGKSHYQDDKARLHDLLDLAKKVSPELLAKTAIYSVEKAFMKDVPVLLLGVLRWRDPHLYEKVFSRVIKNGRLLRRFVQILRSPYFNSRSLSSKTRRLIQNWFESRTPYQIWEESLGNNPSLKDVINLAHVNPGSAESRQAVFKLICKNEKSSKLPQVIKNFYAWKENRELPIPKVSFLRLTSEKLTASDWSQVVKNMTWNQLRLNLNAIERSGALEDKETEQYIAERLSNVEEVRKAKVFPHEIYTTLVNVTNDKALKALNHALNVSIENLPNLGRTVIAIDVSGSMACPLNSNNVNGGLTCSEVSAVLGLSLVRKSRETNTFLTFDTEVHENSLNFDTDLKTQVKNLRFSGGGTDCSAPFKWTLNNKLEIDTFVMISDNESWADYSGNYHWRSKTPSKNLWLEIKKSNPKAKLIMIDMMTSGGNQVDPGNDVLAIAGYSPAILETIKNWLDDSKENLVNTINQINLE